MAVVPRKRKGKTVYGVLTSWGKDKPPHWELVGPNKREAEDLDRKRRKEVRQGTFRPGQVTGESSVSAYAAGWLAKRANRAAAADRSTMRDHALSAEWFSKMPITDVRPKHIIQLIEEIKGRGTMAPKSLTNLMGVLRVMFRDATIAEVIAASPYVVPKGMLSRRGKKRIPYTVDELEALCSDVVGERQQVWNILAFYLGARMGEICGLRWSDWDEGPAPLGSMRIERQYEGRETKTGRLRVVPVHPRLADALKAWRARWSLHYLRRPTPTDFIVPVRADESISRTVAYKCWRKACDVALVTNKTVHSTRHTFITLTQRGGADRRIVELITHNPKEEIIDTYTTRAWSELCEAVLCMPSARASKTPSPSGSPEGNGGSGTSAETPDLQNVPTLPEVGRVRVLESEQRNCRKEPAKAGSFSLWAWPVAPPASQLWAKRWASRGYGRLVALPPSLARAILFPVIGLAALPIMFVGCGKTPTLAEPLVRCAAGTTAPVELELEQALPVEGGVGFQPSGLYLSSGRLLMVSDKHDDAVFELSLQSDRAVARPFVTFHAPGGETLDLEGLTGGEGGSLLLASEAQFRILAVSPSGKATWSTPSLEKAGQEQGLFQKRNAGIEGVAKMGTQLVIAAEREPRGLLEATDGSVGKVLAYRLPRAACSARVGRPDDTADLSVAGGELYALERNAHLVVRLTRVDGRFREAGYWSYARTENDPRFRYPERAFGLGEGLALDEEHVYIVLDNNGQPRGSAKDDHRALLFVFKRPR